jgi:transposase InsO family protein
MGPFNEYRNFGVLDGCSEDMILGMPWMTDHNPNVDYLTRTMSIKQTNAKGLTRTVTFHALTAKIKQHVAGSNIKFLRLKTLRKLMRNKHTRKLIEGYWVNLRATLAASADATSTSSKCNGINAATISAVLGDAGDPRPGTPRDQGPDKIGGGGEGSPMPFGERMAALVEEFKGLFAKPTGVINRPGFEHHINLVEGATPTKSPTYRMTPKMLEETRRQLTELLDRGHIRPSSSPFAAPILFVGKKDSDELRMCVDYRRLNKFTVKDSYPIPRIDQLIDVLHGAEKFTKLDLASAFNQIPVAKDDVQKTAFSTRYGHFEFLVLPFGLCNAPATCMRFMQHVLGDYLDKFVIVYMDDLCIFSDEASHEECVRKVLRRLDEANLRLKREKCTFGADSISYLGHVISRDGVAMDPSKITSIVEWPTPKNVGDVRSFLGLIGYYRKFLVGFGEISAPLVELTKKESRWAWDANHQRSFKALKEMLTTAPTLIIPDTSPGKSFVIHIDASDYAVGAVLLQDQGLGLQPCAYYSKKLDPAQRHYSVGDKEMLAMKLALVEYKIYVEGLPTVMCTDHRNNVDLLTRPVDKVASRRVARVIEFMQQFLPNLTLAYIKGEDNMADPPSRRPDFKEEDEKENGGYAEGEEAHPISKFFKQPADQLKQLFESTTVTREHLQDPSDPSKLLPAIRCNVLRIASGELERDIIAAYGRDPNYRRDRRRTNPFLQLVNRPPGQELYRHDGKIAVPDDDGIKKRILGLCHDGQAHIGEAKVLAAVGLRFWWPNMATDVKSYVKACADCQRAKSSTQKPYGLLMPIKAPERNFQVITMDFLSADLKSRGKSAIFVVVDKRSKFMIAYPTVTTATSQAVIQMLQREVFDKFAVPEAIICDNDIRFTSEEFKDFCGNLGITLRFTTIAHPQANGQTERGNRTIKDLLSATTKYPSQWRDRLPGVVKAYNGSKNASTGESPYLLVYARHPRQAIDKAVPSALPRGGHPGRTVQQIQDAVSRNLNNAAQQQAKYYNKRRRHITYSPGDKVYVDARYLPSYMRRGPRHKFANKREGPFQVVEQLNQNSYAVRVPIGLRGRYKDLHLSIEKLAPYRGDARWQLDPGFVRRQPRRAIEKIQSHFQQEGRTRRYLVRYKDHHPGLDEYVLAGDIPDDQRRAYHTRHGLSSSGSESE